MTETPRAQAAPCLPQHVGVVVVGAGLSGVGAAYRLQRECPERDYLILEGRESLGGTWDLFRYPGIRSDSDMFTLGYPFKPWRDAKSIADGPSILSYIEETAQEFGIDKHIRYGCKVQALDWSSDDSRWTVTIDRAGHTQALTCDFVYVCAGYYDYDQGHAPQFPGIDDFAGHVVHPQFWPENLDYSGKRVVVIGSGATAVTLLPSMAERGAAHVTMLQRSPTWISAVPSRDKRADWLRARLPEQLAHRVIRAKNVAVNMAFYQFCQRRPHQARKLLLSQTTRILGDADLVAEHFTPSYRPWDQRLCAAPGADFKAIKAGKADVVTDTIDSFTPDGIRLTSGRLIEADVVVTATGLALQTFGGIEISVDSASIDHGTQFVWRGALVSGIPNFAFCVGYTNASWTLRADISSRLVCRVLNWMRDNGHTAVVPTATGDLEPRPLFELTSGYVQRSVDAFPKQSRRGPWRMRQNYLLDAVSTLHGDPGKELAPVRASATVSGREGMR